MRAQTRQFLTIAWIVPVRCLHSSDCQADCSTLWGRKHGSFWVQNGQCMCVRRSVLHGQRIVVGHALEPSELECRCLRNMLDTSHKSEVRYNQYTNVTDRQTPHDRQHRPRCAWRRVAKTVQLSDEIGFHMTQQHKLKCKMRWQVMGATGRQDRFVVVIVSFSQFDFMRHARPEMLSCSIREIGSLANRLLTNGALSCFNLRWHLSPSSAKTERIMYMTCRGQPTHPTRLSPFS